LQNREADTRFKTIREGKETEAKRSTQTQRRIRKKNRKRPTHGSSKEADTVKRVVKKGYPSTITRGQGGGRSAKGVGNRQDTNRSPPDSTHKGGKQGKKKPAVASGSGRRNKRKVWAQLLSGPETMKKKTTKMDEEEGGKNSARNHKKKTCRGFIRNTPDR